MSCCRTGLLLFCAGSLVFQPLLNIPLFIPPHYLAPTSSLQDPEEDPFKDFLFELVSTVAESAREVIEAEDERDSQQRAKEKEKARAIISGFSMELQPEGALLLDKMESQSHEVFDLFDQLQSLFAQIRDPKIQQRILKLGKELADKNVDPTPTFRALNGIFGALKDYPVVYYARSPQALIDWLLVPLQYFLSQLYGKPTVVPLLFLPEKSFEQILDWVVALQSNPRNAAFAVRNLQSCIKRFVFLVKQRAPSEKELARHTHVARFHKLDQLVQMGILLHKKGIDPQYFYAALWNCAQKASSPEEFYKLAEELSHLFLKLQIEMAEAYEDPLREEVWFHAKNLIGVLNETTLREEAATLVAHFARSKKDPRKVLMRLRDMIVNQKLNHVQIGSLFKLTGALSENQIDPYPTLDHLRDLLTRIPEESIRINLIDLGIRMAAQKQSPEILYQDLESFYKLQKSIHRDDSVLEIVRHLIDFKINPSSFFVLHHHIKKPFFDTSTLMQLASIVVEMHQALDAQQISVEETVQPICKNDYYFDTLEECREKMRLVREGLVRLKTDLEQKGIDGKEVIALAQDLSLQITSDEKNQKLFSLLREGVTDLHQSFSFRKVELSPALGLLKHWLGNDLGAYRRIFKSIQKGIISLDMALWERKFSQKEEMEAFVQLVAKRNYFQQPSAEDADFETLFSPNTSGIEKVLSIFSLISEKKKGEKKESAFSSEDVDLIFEVALKIVKNEENPIARFHALKPFFNQLEGDEKFRLFLKSALRLMERGTHLNNSLVSLTALIPYLNEMSLNRTQQFLTQWVDDIIPRQTEINRLFSALPVEGLSPGSQAYLKLLMFAEFKKQGRFSDEFKERISKQEIPRLKKMEESFKPFPQMRIELMVMHNRSSKAMEASQLVYLFNMISETSDNSAPHFQYTSNDKFPIHLPLAPYPVCVELVQKLREYKFLSENEHYSIVVDYDYSQQGPFLDLVLTFCLIPASDYSIGQHDFWDLMKRDKDEDEYNLNVATLSLEDKAKANEKKKRTRFMQALNLTLLSKKKRCDWTPYLLADLRRVMLLARGAQSMDEKEGNRVLKSIYLKHRENIYRFLLENLPDQKEEIEMMFQNPKGTQPKDFVAVHHYMNHLCSAHPEKYQAFQQLVETFVNEIESVALSSEEPPVSSPETVEVSI